MISKGWLRQAIKAAVRSIGLNPRLFSGHSLRAGGATDLFALRVPYGIIKRLGRWKSEAFLIYYRDEADVQHAVFAAFDMLAATRA